ncbi:MAG: adenylate kinase [Candidatus Hydrogenedentes bacterium]|nr:adenylate kinase [Candidatus Hydrogenedentota bacterium]
MAGHLLILGAPGAGKGTQAMRLAGKHRWAHISTGDIFRRHGERGTEFGKKIEGYLKAGELVPDSLTCEVLVDRLSQSDCDNGYILDGFPRSVRQAEQLDRMLEEREEALDAVIVLDIGDDEIVERLTARRNCPKCGKIYNLKFSPPAIEGACDNETCGGAALEEREDDCEETIRQRLKVYHESTEPLIEHYAARELVQSIDAAAEGPCEIADKIEDILLAQGVS